MSRIIKSAPVVLALTLLATPGTAQEPDFGGMTSTGGAAGETRDAVKDRQTILFLSRHIRQLEAEADRARRFQAEKQAELERVEAEIARRKAAAEERRRKANRRAARNGAISIIGALAGEDVSGDIAFLNAVDDVSDAFSAKDEQDMADFRRRNIYQPLLFGDSNDMRDMDNFWVGIRENRRVREYSSQLEAARARTRQGQIDGENMEAYVQGLERDAAEASALLRQFSADYLAEVNAIAQAVPGFRAAFQQVEAITFDLEQGPGSTKPLIQSLIFSIHVPGATQADRVEVPLTMVREFVEDQFATLIQQRAANVQRIRDEIEAVEQQRASDTAQRARIQRDIDAQKRLLDATARYKLITRGRINDEIERLERMKANVGDPANENLPAKRRQHTQAQHLLTRANYARTQFLKLDQAAAQRAVEQIERLL